MSDHDHYHDDEVREYGRGNGAGQREIMASDPSCVFGCEWMSNPQT
jgi:hypothetical protein